MALRHVGLICRTELRHRARTVRRDDQKLGFLVLGVPIVAILTVLLARYAYAMGRQATAVAGLLTTVEAALTAAGTSAALVVGLRVLQDVAGPTAPSGVLTAARHRDVVGAHLLVEALYVFALVGVPGTIAAFAFALGAGSAATAVSAPLAVALVVLNGTLLGFVVGHGLRLSVARSRLLARFKTAAVVVLVCGYFVAIAATDVVAVLGRVLGVLQSTPLGWFGDLALVGVVAEAERGRAVLALLTGGLTLAGLTWLNCRLAAALWYGSSVERTVPTGSSVRLHLPLTGRRTTHVVHKTWKRARRTPIKLVYVGYGAVLILMLLADAVTDGAVPAVLVYLVAWYGAWATGAAFTLNPLGEEWPVLPMTATTPSPGRPVVRGSWLAAALPGAPLTAAATLLVAVPSPLSPGGVLLVAVLGACLAALSPGLGASIGLLFPRTDRVNLFRSGKTVVPSAAAFYGYSIGLGLLTLPMWAGLPGISSGAAASGFPAVSRLASAAAAVLLLAVSAATSSRYAADRLDEYTVG